MLLGYDIGSSSVKVALVDADTQIEIARAKFPEREMSISSPKVGWAEQNPEDWWQNVLKVTELLFSNTKIDRSKITAIGISYQMHGLVVLDKQGEVIRPSIIWCDSRAVSIGDKAFKEIGKEKCLKNLLNSPGNFTASKLKWIQENEPQLYKKIDKIMLPGDFIAYKFTGEPNTTSTGLSEGIFWDFQKNELSKLLMEHYQFETTLIPDVVPVFANQGNIKKDLAIQLGFSQKLTVSYRAGDQPNNAFSMGVFEPGEIAATAGTSGVVYGVVDKLKYDAQNRVNSFAHINHTKENNRIGILLCINGTGSAYSWLRNNLSAGTSYLDLEKMAAEIPIGSEGLSFLPFGNGAERLLGNKLMGAEYKGLQFNQHALPHMTRACLEGIAFSFVYGIQCMKELGLDPKIIKAGNDNMFQSHIFSETIVALTGSEIQLIETTGAVGAALGAGYGSGVFNDLKEVFSKQEVIKTYSSTGKHQAAYEEAYGKWVANL